jgi:hypothetical protein
MIATNPITNTEDYLDTRDILERINYLEINEFTLDESETEELETLKKLIEEVRLYSGDEPEVGVELIRDTYFIDYAQELAEDTLPAGARLVWPLMYIDWERVADDMKIDYSAVDFDGVDYWVKS